MKALILAAGYGTRLKPFTDSIPKACMPVFNLPQILYGCELLEQAGVTEVIINTHHLAGDVVSAINKYQNNTSLKFSFSHEAEILNSGGGIKKTKEFFAKEDHFFILNADSLILPEDTTLLSKLYHQHTQSEALVTMASVDIQQLIPAAKDTDESLSYGALWSHNNKITSIGKNKPDNDSLASHFIGAYVFSTKVFDMFPEDDAFHIFDGLIYEQLRAGHVFNFKLENTTWLETGNPTDFIFAHKKIFDLLQHNDPKAKLITESWKKHQPEIIPHTKTTWAPKGFDTTMLNSTAHYFISNNATIDRGANIEGLIVLCEDQAIYQGQRISNSVIIKNSDSLTQANKEIVLV